MALLIVAGLWALCAVQLGLQLYEVDADTISPPPASAATTITPLDAPEPVGGVPSREHA